MKAWWSCTVVHSHPMVRTRHLLIKLLLTSLLAAALCLIYLDARITATFANKMWELPAKVYARPLELFVGSKLRQDDLQYELEALGYRKVSTLRNPGELVQQGNRFDIFTRGFNFPGEREPAHRVRVDLADERVAGLAASGKNIDLMRLDPLQIGGIYPSHGEDRVLVKLDNVPESLEVTVKNDEGYVMALRHKEYDVRGVQFHPESVLTEYGGLIIKNWVHHVVEK